MADFPVLQVQPDEVTSDEALGSKTKFWFRRDAERWLFKEARGGTGEDWAEKVASEVARLVGINAATVELADYEGRRGCASLSFAYREKGDVLIHGNEILAGMVLGYDRNKRFRQSDHTLENITAAIGKLFPQAELNRAVLTTLAGYLVFDALIGNTDRHHENWAILLRAPTSILEVAPTFDHASSLGRELQDPRRLILLQNDRVEDYVRRGRGAIYLRTNDARGANPLRLVEYGTRQFAEYFSPILRQLQRLSPPDFRSILDRVPEARMSETSKAFALAYMTYTYETLCKLIK
jgi:HipA-like C-terminal domain